MLAREFETACADALNEHLSAVSRGPWPATRDEILLYPTHLLISESAHHFSAELLGLSPTRTRLKVAKARDVDLNEYLGSPPSTKQYWWTGPLEPAEPTVRDVSFWDQVIFMNGIQDTYTARYPASIPRHRILLENDMGFINANRRISNLTLIRITAFSKSFTGSARIRRIHYCTVFHRDDPASLVNSEIRRFLSSNLDRFPGLDIIRNSDSDSPRLKAEQFSSLFLMDRVHETTLADFISRHEEILRGGLGATNVVLHPELLWQRGTVAADEKSIIPDFLYRSIDGNWNVGDFKLALVRDRSLTTQKAKRRRLKASVYDGVAQLAHYQDYFTYPENRTYVQDKLGIQISEPAALLLIGNAENYDSIAMAQALRAHTGKIEIMNYDTLVQMYLAGQGISIPVV